jgi:hypothetical protein
MRVVSALEVGTGLGPDGLVLPFTPLERRNCASAACGSPGVWGKVAGMGGDGQGRSA